MNPETQRPSTPPADPLIDEVRSIRQKISEEFGHDVDRLVEHLREIERKYSKRVVQPADVRRNGTATTAP